LSCTSRSSRASRAQRRSIRGLFCSLTFANATPNQTIPDNSLTGRASQITVATPITTILSVDLTLNIAGGYNGDYYAYLQYGSGLVVLLNRLDATPGNPYGSPGSGFRVTFNDAAPSISTAPAIAGQPLTGTFAPQGGRLGSAFDGLNPNGTWTLFIADESPGGVGTLASWSLQISGPGPAPVPESSGTTAGLFAVGLTALSALRVVRRS